ncbi:protease [Luteitalea sp. TBR-22]|uniref:immune inhibitor A domain-containing protein n=1 Tax=Luteitalea sp. TBR-22 TaxID=2802971 RepID=UPI001AF869B3|nr:immune inhibitor A domain-containing protein [Luteitalea sp. TBR-22]BCS31685.1 protease [Luteitalea sp. TBR-22]
MKPTTTIATLAFALLLASPPLALAQAPAQDGADLAAIPAGKSDSPAHPLGTVQRQLRTRGLQARLAGKARGKIYKVAKGQFVELARQGEDTIWTVLGQFGTSINPSYGGTPGPVRNQIPQPDRTVDNTSIWAADFSQAYYTNLLFSGAPGAISMRNFYIEQSSNRYTVNGGVEDWVTVPFNEANYGSNYCGGIVCARTWLFVRDTVNAWYNAQIAAGKSPADIEASLARYDVWDRYDYDGDGNFNEPDGYIDHFQAVHAGEGEETGGGAQGTDAIWSHRWYAFYNNIGFTGPAFNKLGGVKVGGTNLWIGDYTVEPENGGVGVFAHEFGHDLGLPDLYDTSGNTGGAENSTGFWTLYSSGSYGSTGQAAEGIGSKPIPMSAYEKIFLNWSNYELLGPGQSKSVKLGPAMANTKQAQQLIVLLPEKKIETALYPPYAGSAFYTSGNGNGLDNSMTRQVTLPTGAPLLTAKVRYEIEQDWDYAYVTVNGNAVATSRSVNTNPNGQNFGNGITGSSGGAWVDLVADLSAFSGQSVTIGFRYWTDGAVVETGFSVDDLNITGQAPDGAETDAGWTFNGFSTTGGVTSQSFFNAYFAEYRTYRGYDDGLRTGPYNFGFPTTPNWVEHYPYQDGLLVWYYDTSFADNNVGDYCLAGRCGGLVLPVDAHPELMVRPDNGRVWRPRFQAFDSTFGVEPTDKVCLHASGVEQCYGGLPANPVFDDSQSYWVAPNPAIGNFGWASVAVPNTGTTIRVTSVSALGNLMQVIVNQR